MAATTSASPHQKFQTHPIQSTRRRSRQNTITLTSAISSSSSATHNNHHHHRKLVPVPVVSPDNSWCCPASKPLHPPSPPLEPQSNSIPEPISLSSAPSPSNLKFRYSPSTLAQIMDSVPTTTTHYCASANAAVYGGASTPDYFPQSFSKFNSALTAGLLNPMSPPPSSADKLTRSSPTLFEMITSDSDCHPKPQIAATNVVVSTPKAQLLPQNKQALMQQRIWDLLSCRSPGNQFNDPSSSDMKLTLSSKDGLSVAMNVHRKILVAHGQYFAVKLSDQWTEEQKSLSPYIVEIADCDDIEVYIETIRLMYCKDLRKKLMKEDVSKVLGILKVSVAIGFDDGVLSCLEYLEAAPWDEDEEEKVASLLSELQLEAVGAAEVLKRVSGDVTAGVDDGNESEGVLLKLLHVILEGKDGKARREMKGLVSKMLHENLSQNNLRKESLYSACDGCLQLLRHHFLRVAAADLQDVGQIARQADNLHWILDILIDRQIAGDFLKTWGAQSELADAHSKVPAIHRYEISRVTARLFVGIGKGQLLASKDARCLLLQTWLVPFYDDFGWMRRASKGLDRHLIEDGLSNTILTLPLASQQDILMSWFDRFLNSGEDCPNIQRGFEVWWRRAFWRRNGEPERPWQMQITTENS